VRRFSPSPTAFAERLSDESHAYGSPRAAIT
jgi:hypothetical protein